jgi:Berberine and berberine like
MNPTSAAMCERARRLANLSPWAVDLQCRAYVNFMMDDEAEGRVQATYGENYRRLASVRAKYDPENLFRVN